MAFEAGQNNNRQALNPSLIAEPSPRGLMAAAKGTAAGYGQLYRNPVKWRREA